MAQDYLLLKIDTERDLNGEQVGNRLTDGRSPGFPWSVVLDGDGKALVNSDRPADDGPQNIGCPVSPEEQAWFVEMVKRSKQHMSDAGLTILASELAEFAKGFDR